MSVDLLIVGPESRETGGVARYVAEQRSRLPDDVDPRVYDVGTPEWRSTAGYLRAVATSVADALRFPFQRPPDVVHVHSSHRFAFYRAAWYVLFASLVWRRPVVLHVHGSSFDEFVATASRPLRVFQAAVFGATDAVVVLSEYWRDQLSRVVPPDKLVVLPNAIDPSGYDPEIGSATDDDATAPDDDGPTAANDGADEGADEEQRMRVTFVSHLVPRKGVEEFVAAVDRLQREGRSFEVRVAGAGRLADEVEALAADHDAVEYLGYVPEDEKRALLDRSSIYVLPTYAEGLPIALLEGMAGGNAVVTTGVGAIPEVVDESNGRLVDPGDADALADALADLLDDPATTAEMGRRNRRLVADEYSWSTVAARLASLYRSLADGPDGAGADDPDVATDGSTPSVGGSRVATDGSIDVDAETTTNGAEAPEEAAGAGSTADPARNGAEEPADDDAVRDEPVGDA